MKKVEIIEELKKELSTDYRGWLEMLLRHIEEYGETPEMQLIGKSFKNYELWKNGEQIEGREGIIPDAETIIIKDDKVYEIRNCDLFVADCTADQYLNYRKPMCYNAYINIL